MDAVTVHPVETSSLSDLVETDNEGLPGHGMVTFGCFVSTKEAIGGGVVGQEVLVEGIRQVCGTILPGPVDFLACRAGCHAWKDKDFGVEAIVIGVILHTIVGDVPRGVE